MEIYLKAQSGYHILSTTACNIWESKWMQKEQQREQIKANILNHRSDEIFYHCL